jgi:hypothetical protein
MLYIKTAAHVVLLNNIVKGAHLGRLRNRRRVHIDPEADLIIIPRSEVLSIEVASKR